MEQGYPVSLNLQEKPCLVIGGGAVACRKAETLIAHGAQVDVITLAATDEMRALCAQNGCNLTLRGYEDGDESGYFLVYAATGDTKVNRRIAENCRRERVWLNAVDDPENCDFYVPALLRHGPVSVAVSTDGNSPVLAAYLRDMIAAQVTEEYGTLAKLFGEVRNEINASGRSMEEKKAFYRDLMAKDPITMLRQEGTDQVREIFKACISSWLD